MNTLSNLRILSSLFRHCMEARRLGHHISPFDIWECVGHIDVSPSGISFSLMTGLGWYLSDSWGFGEREGWRLEVLVLKRYLIRKASNLGYTADEVDVLCGDSGHFF